QMGEMISMIAHQWRQPLGSISSTIIDLQVKLQLDTFNLEDKEGVDSMIKYMDKKHENIIELLQFLSTTINDFRDFFKPDKAKKFITLTTPINKTLQIIESSLLNNNIEIIKDFQIDDELSLYQNEMTQVILNILKNSEDNFLEKNILNPKITISTQEEHGTYIISISDNGGGIPEDILPNIFNPYFSTKDEKNGTGLGLYMSKTMIEKHHGGKLRAYNTEDGVIFKIILYTKDYKEQCIFDEL
ncbi:MAG: HAMP domain-containing histidine kinase, partial [Sulfurimonas sp.]|nr:HAMP domain-containing histidine kinase [Sulfurimonas sp.]